MQTIPLTQGKVALVDDEDYDLLKTFKWWPAKDGRRWYASRNIKKDGIWTSVRMHNMILPAVCGKETDHRDGNGLNNQKSNLRHVTRSQNRMNSASRGNYTGFKGVSFDGRGKPRPFWARVRVMGRAYQSGYFQTAIEAARAYNALALRHFGEYAHLNKV